MERIQWTDRTPLFLWPMALALTGLMFLGVMFIYSASQSGTTDLSWMREYHSRQVVMYGLGVFAGWVVSLVDYQKLVRWCLPFYLGSLALLIYVLIFGDTIGGAKRWIDLKVFQLQPSELAKLGVIFVLAQEMSRPVGELKDLRAFVRPAILVFIPFVLILKEPDLGSALLLGPVTLAIFFVAGIPKRYLVWVLGGGTFLVGFVLVNLLWVPEEFRLVDLEPYQKHRIMVFLGKEKNYNVEQALISVGSGQWTGKGWNQGIQNALGFLPRSVAHNDFIFSVIAEEKGFLGSLLVLFLYSVVLATGLFIASEARDRLGKLLAVGVVTLIFSQVFINIGMNIRLMPVTGIPLPLLSYGGTSVVCSLIGIGVLMNVYRFRRIY